MNSGIRGLARLVVIANIVFVLAWQVAVVWQGPNYSFTAHSISDMYSQGAPGAWFLIGTFTLCGAVVILFAFWSLWPSIREAGWPARVAAILLALSIFGLGDLLSVFEQQACRLADAGCTAEAQAANFGGAADASLSTFGGFALAACGFFLAVAMKRLPRWRSWSRPTLISAIVFVALLLLDGALGGINYGGLGERLLAFGGALGIAALGVGVLRRGRVPAEATYAVA